MTIWLIEPRDPIIFRDGRPFNASPGARAKTLSFPLPATIAGATRTHAGLDANGRFDASRIAELQGKRVRGPLLVELHEDGRVKEWLFPAPADALLFKHDPYDRKLVRIVPLTAVATPSGTASNLPAGLALVGSTEPANAKPHPKTPAFWRWDHYRDWLSEPKAQDVELEGFGRSGPARESRMHVSIKADTQTAEDGALFQTSGLEFVHTPTEEDVSHPSLAQAQMLGLVVETDAGLREGLGFLGGERRVARWRSGPDRLPECPPKVRQAIIASRHCRLILATPALFTQGYLPDSAKLSRFGVTVSVQAVVNQRYQVVSGWDYAKSRPKSARRLVPAGSVYFLQLGGNDNDIGRLVDDVWLRAISDDEQDCRDGFGLAVLGAWDGIPKPLIYHAEDDAS